MSKSYSPLTAAELRLLAQEPWVDLSNGREMAEWGNAEQIVYNQVNRQSQKWKYFVKQFDFLDAQRTKGNYLEFGCHRVRTFRMALTEARRHNFDFMKFFAFDSFQGLPAPVTAPSTELWHEGALCTTLEQFHQLIAEQGVYVDKVKAIKGFFDQSLTPELQQQFLAGEQPIAMATIDCDLYESAKPVFAFIEPLLQEGSVLYIDDLFDGYGGSPCKGVARAFQEFRAKSRFKFVRHLDVGWWGRSYIAYSPVEGVPDFPL